MGCNRTKGSPPVTASIMGATGSEWAPLTGQIVVAYALQRTTSPDRRHPCSNPGGGVRESDAPGGHEPYGRKHFLQCVPMANAAGSGFRGLGATGRAFAVLPQPIGLEEGPGGQPEPRRVI